MSKGKTMLDVLRDNMPEHELIAFRHTNSICGRKPDLDELVKCARRNPDCVLETAWHLSPDEYRTLEEIVRKKEKHDSENRPQIRRR